MMDDRTHFGDSPLHNQEVRVVDVQLHALEECLDTVLLRLMSIQKVF